MHSGVHKVTGYFCVKPDPAQPGVCRAATSQCRSVLWVCGYRWQHRETANLAGEEPQQQKAHAYVCLCGDSEPKKKLVKAATVLKDRWLSRESAAARRTRQR